MFNAFTHFKQATKLKQAQDQALSDEKSKEKRCKHRNLLSKRYYDRVSEHLQRLADEAAGPSEVKLSEPRSTRAFLQSQGVHTQHERVTLSSQWNSWLDTCPPQQSTFKLRPRDKSKELHPPLSIRPKSGRQRLEETVAQQRQLLDSSYAPGSSSSGWYKDFYGRRKLSVPGGKELVQYYHCKTYFKGIQAIGTHKAPEQSKSVLERFNVRPRSVGRT